MGCMRKILWICIINVFFDQHHLFTGVNLFSVLTQMQQEFPSNKQPLLLLVSACSLAFARQLHKQMKWAVSFQKQSSPPQPTGFNSFIYSIWRCPWGTFQNHLLLFPLFAWWAAKRRSDADSEEAALANRGEVRTVSDNTWKPLLSWVFPSVRASGIALLFLRLHQIQISMVKYKECCFLYVFSAHLKACPKMFTQSTTVEIK